MNFGIFITPCNTAAAYLLDVFRKMQSYARCIASDNLQLKSILNLTLISYAFALRFQTMLGYEGGKT